MKARHALSFILLFLASGCVSNISEEGGPCPCGPGWTCCEEDGVCIREGEMCLTGFQKLLLALEGTWIGTADEAGTMSGSKRIVMEMTLPATGEPTLEGLTGGIMFGEGPDTRPADPDYPRIDEFHNKEDIRDGFMFTFLNMAFLNGRLLADFHIYEQWKEFCEAQTDIYHMAADLYTCNPYGEGWWDVGGEGPDGEEGIIYHGPNGEEIFVTYEKEELCSFVCVCDSSGCTVDISQGPASGNFDLSVDIEKGIILGTSNEGRIEAVKQ